MAIDLLTRTRHTAEAAGAAPERPTGQIAYPTDWAGAYGLYMGARAASDNAPAGSVNEDALVEAYCRAMDNLIANVAAPDAAALNVKLELIRERYDPGKNEGEIMFPLKVFDALRSDVIRLTAQRPATGGGVRASVSAQELKRASEVAQAVEDVVTFAKGVLHAIHSGGLLENLPADPQYHDDAHAGSILLNELERRLIEAERLAQSEPRGGLWLFLDALAKQAA